MEVTKWLKPLVSVSRIGDSASVQAVTRVSAPGETGKEYVVKVHCDEGVAIHVAPDPCAGVREDVGEASVGERIGQPLSRETVINPSADVVYLTEGKIGRRDIASAHRARRGLRPWHVRTLLVREPGDLWIGHKPSGPMVRGGKARSRSR